MRGTDQPIGPAVKEQNRHRDPGSGRGEIRPIITAFHRRVLQILVPTRHLGKAGIHDLDALVRRIGHLPEEAALPELPEEGLSAVDRGDGLVGIEARVSPTAVGSAAEELTGFGDSFFRALVEVQAAVEGQYSGPSSPEWLRDAAGHSPFAVSRQRNGRASASVRCPAPL